ncbi:MAG: hypothetical protein KDC45_10185, partial [Bacteroidetes bacterium]|nr:hypothetical protein [Bacteroidota bacterium]
MMNLSSVQDGSPDNQDQRERVFTSTLTRIRLRPILYLSDNVRLVWEHEIDAAYSSQSLQAKSSSGSRQFVDLTWRPVREDNLQLSHFVDRAYLRVDFRHSNVVAGRQRIAWGVGRIWNPTDLFNPINPADFTKIEKDGADAVSAKWNIGSFTDVQAVVIPQEKPGRSHAGARFRSNVGETDWSVMTGYFDRRTVLGADAAGNFGGAGFRVEGALFSMANSKKPDYLRAVAGVDYQFTSR